MAACEAGGEVIAQLQRGGSRHPTTRPLHAWLAGALLPSVFSELQAYPLAWYQSELLE